MTASKATELHFQPHETGLLGRVLTAPAYLWSSLVAWNERSAEAHAVATMEDHLRRDLGMPPLPPQARPPRHFI